MIGSTSAQRGCGRGISGGAGSSGPTSAIAAKMTAPAAASAEPFGRRGVNHRTLVDDAATRPRHLAAKVRLPAASGSPRQDVGHYRSAPRSTIRRLDLFRNAEIFGGTAADARGGPHYFVVGHPTKSPQHANPQICGFPHGPQSEGLSLRGPILDHGPKPAVRGQGWRPGTRLIAIC
jgi:hypothetical protein